MGRVPRAPLLLYIVWVAGCRGEGIKHLIVSTPVSGKVAYLTLPSSGAPALDAGSMLPLIESGLTYPQGIAVDSYRQMLYVADPQLNKLVRYPLVHNGRTQLSVGSQQDVALNVETRAVAVDGLGNVWFTDEPNQKIFRISAKNISLGVTTPEQMYVGSPNISAPGGIALDNYFAYWLNKASGTTSGSVVRGAQKQNTATLISMSSNVDKSYGVCLGLNNIFYTDDLTNVYGITRSATPLQSATTISSNFTEPRGCAFDGDNTVYVADKGRDAVYQFASNMNPLLSNRPVVKAADLLGAFGVAVYTRTITS